VSKQAAHKRHARRRAGRGAATGSGEQRLVVLGRARSAVALARQEASALGSPATGTEHLLLGLLRQDDGPASEALNSLGISAVAVRGRVEGVSDQVSALGVASGRRPTTAAGAPMTPRGREALEQSLREAVRLGDGYLGVEHLLLALLRDRDGGATRTLRALGVEPERVEARLEQVIGR